MSEDWQEEQPEERKPEAHEAVGAGAAGVSAKSIEELASSLLWRIGRAEGEERITVRAGFASSAELFQSLPRLRSASDAEVEAALKEGDVRFEWVGAGFRAGARGPLARRRVPRRASPRRGSESGE